MREIGRSDLFAPPAERGLIGEHGEHDGSNRGHAPRSDPPQRTVVEFVLFGEKPGQAALLGVDAGAGLFVRFFCHGW